MITDIIEQRSMPVTESGCWFWLASKTKQGYGDFRIGGKHMLAHRASYEAFNGPIPDSLHVLHRCDVRCCVNPAHLFVGTNNDNINDSMIKNRRKGVTRNRPIGLKYKPMSIIGRENHRKLKSKDFSYVVAMRESGLSQREIAKRFGVSQATISKALKCL